MTVAIKTFSVGFAYVRTVLAGFAVYVDHPENDQGVVAVALYTDKTTAIEKMNNLTTARVF